MLIKDFMPAIVRSEFALALNQVCSERGIDPEVVLETIRAAIVAAYRKDFPQDFSGNPDDYQVDLNADTGEAKILKDGKDITPPGFGRIAAQTAKQVILQRIREAEKSAILSDYATRVGAIINGRVLRFDGPNIIVDVGRTEGVMPPQEQIQSEHYHLNQRLIVYLKEIKDTLRGSEIIVSRADKGLVEGLFKREVPEIQNKAVEIKVIAREAGSRSKVAVASTQSGVDPVGSCVGQKGVRVQAVISELGGLEKLDIIQWSDDPAKFIASALAPTKDLIVELDQKNQEALVLVPDDQLSLAIGRDGQNVRLAVKLTGWKINIRGKSEAEKPSSKAARPTDKKVAKKTTKKAKTNTAKND